MIRFPFRERKAAQAAAHLLRRHSGEMYYLLLLKLLYLADRYALLETGRTITGDRMVSMDWGPVISQTYALISTGVNPETGTGRQWYEYVSEPAGWKVRVVKDDPETDELSEYEIDVLEQTDQTYGGWDRWVLSEWTHSLPEWHDPQGSSLPIKLEEILRAEGKSEEEIQRIAEDAEASTFIQTFLVAR